MSSYSCRDCGHEAHRWFGRCPACGAWSSAITAAEHENAVVSLDACGGDTARRACGVSELDRVLGGGFVEGSAVLLAGEPGIGKSTLVLQLLAGLALGGARVLLATGEESANQVGSRAARLGVAAPALRVMATGSCPAVLSSATSEGADVVVVDSIQTLTDPEVDGAPGAVGQVRECAARLVRHAKETGCTVVLVGHVTKEGSVAGPKTLEHMVDVVLSLEGERAGSLRLLRSLKNRYGSCDETGVLVMEGEGLLPVDDPSALLLQDRRSDVAGSIVFPTLEGSRAVLLEIQALVDSASGAQPRRTSVGIDARRLTLACALLGRRVGLSLGERDVFVAVAGGLRVAEPAGDLALCLALASGATGSVVERDLVAVGEVGLAGEVRRVPGIDRRLVEARRMGFTRALVPSCDVRAPADMAVIAVADVATAVGLACSEASYIPV